VTRLAGERGSIDPGSAQTPLRTTTSIEKLALSHARDGKFEQASALVMGGTYQVERSRYTAAVAALTRSIEEQLRRDLDHSEQRLHTAVALAAVAGGVLSGNAKRSKTRSSTPKDWRA
jgi:hypothetical protein